MRNCQKPKLNIRVAKSLCKERSLKVEVEVKGGMECEEDDEKPPEESMVRIQCFVR